MTGTALVLTSLAGCSFVLLAVVVARCSSSRDSAVIGVVLIGASPFTFSLLVRDVGRYDSVVVVCAAMIAMVGRRTRSPAVIVSVAVGGLLVAAATEELAVAFLVPLALTSMLKAAVRPVLAFLAVVPAAGIAVVSVLIKPDVASMIVNLRAAHAARPDIRLDGRGTAVGALMQTPASALAKLAQLPLEVLALYSSVLGACFMATAWLMWRVAGSPAPRCYWRLTSLYGVSAMALSVIGIDYRRWWSLAFVASAWTLEVLRQRASASVRRPKAPRTVAIAAVLALSVIVQVTPVTGMSVARMIVAQIVRPHDVELAGSA